MPKDDAPLVALVAGISARRLLSARLDHAASRNRSEGLPSFAAPMLPGCSTT